MYLQHNHIQEPFTPTYVLSCQCLHLYYEHTTVTYRAKKSGLSEEFLEESPPRNRPVETKNCSTAAQQLNSTILAGVVCGVTHSLDVSGQRHRPSDIKPSADAKAPHLTPISTKRLVTEKQGSEEHLSSAGIQLPQFTPLPPHLYCCSFPAS